MTIVHIGGAKYFWLPEIRNWFEKLKLYNKKINKTIIWRTACWGFSWRRRRRARAAAVLRSRDAARTASGCRRRWRAAAARPGSRTPALEFILNWMRFARFFFRKRTWRTLADLSEDLRADVREGPARLYCDQVVRLLHRIDDRLRVERPQRAQIDDLIFYYNVVRKIRLFFK